MTAFRRSGDSGYAVPAPSENISANFFPRGKRRRSFIILTARKRIQPLPVQTHGKKRNCAAYPNARKNTTFAACPNTRKKPRLRGITIARKNKTLAACPKGGGRRSCRGKSLFQAKKCGKGQIIYRIFCRCVGKWSYDVRASRRRGRGVRRAKKIRGWGRRRGRRNRCRGLRFDFVDRGQEQSQCVRRWRRVKRERKAG